MGAASAAVFEAVRMVHTPRNVLASSSCAAGTWGNGLFKQRSLPATVRSKKARIAFPTVCLLHGLGGPFWDAPDHHSSSKTGCNKKDKAVLLSLIQQIEPLDVSSISKDASSDSMDAMKRTISGMLGLLPSDQFKVTVEAQREPLARLLVSSMMTGYTLRNAEYRLCLQKSLQLSEDDGVGSQIANDSEERIEACEDHRTLEAPESDQQSPCSEMDHVEDMEKPKVPGSLGRLSKEAGAYISQLQAKMLAMEKELEKCRRAKTALEMERIVGDENNELLDYLRSLEPDKVAELSHPASKEVEQVIQVVIDGLLDDLCKSRRPSKPQVNGPLGANSSWDDKAGVPEFIANAPLKFQSTVTASRDYLARLLFWCMLVGHHMRGLEYRLELSHALNLSVEMGVEE